MQKYILVFLLFSFACSFGQFSVKDSSFLIPMISVHYSGHIPGGDMADRFGNSSMVGGSLALKTKKNWIFSLDGNFLFGNQIKNESFYFHSIKNSQGYVIDGNGMAAEIYLYERGFNFSAHFGKQFKFLNPNPNSGPFVELGFGFLQHKVRIENPYFVAPQVIGDYKPYYDRLSSGLSFTQLIGYRFLSDSRLLNFYLAFEFNQAFTQGRRTYNLDDMKSGAENRIDLLSGIRIGWIMPLYPKAPKEFYYY